jgi:N-acetylmuramoyl-L-alanine amidase
MPIVEPMSTAKFAPDSDLDVEVVPSPNHGDRRDVDRPDMLVLHYTGMADGAGALARLCNPGSEVSAHYVVFEDGRIVQCVPEARRAWHAGAGSWAGQTDINSRSIGIEIVNPGHDGDYPDFPEAQLAAVIALCRDIVGRHAVPPQRVLAHSDVAPERKQDPGEKFPWARLAAAGVGLWTAPQPIVDGLPVLKLGHGSREVRDLQAKLAGFGYGIEATGHFDDRTRQIVTAFQRHFRPARVDGIADASTIATLSKLLAVLGADATIRHTAS